MKLPRRRFLHLAVGATTLPAIGRVACAETYPARPIRLVVPFPPGGAFDTLARPWVEQVKPLLGTVVIENIGGGGSSLGAATVAPVRKAAGSRRDEPPPSHRRTRTSDRGGGGLSWPDQSIDDRAGRSCRNAGADQRADCARGARVARGAGLPAEVDRFRLRSQSRHNAREIPASPRSRCCFLDAGGRGARVEDQLTEARKFHETSPPQILARGRCCAARRVAPRSGASL